MKVEVSLPANNTAKYNGSEVTYVAIELPQDPFLSSYFSVLSSYIDEFPVTMGNTSIYR